MSDHEARRRAGLESVWTSVLLEVDHPTARRTPAHVAADHAAVVHVITAWNPSSTAVDVATNQAADAALRDVLLEAELIHERCTGSNPDGSWLEEGWAVVGLRRDDALEIGRHFGQDAIYESTSDELLIVWCDSGRSVRVERDCW